MPALEARVSALEAPSPQPALSNGPLPPGPVQQIMTLYVPEIGAIDRAQVIYGLILERTLAGYWMLGAPTFSASWPRELSR